MTRMLKLVITFTAACITAVAPAQSAAPDAGAITESSSSHIANVYVSNIVNPNANGYTFNVYAFTTASSGKLTKVSGSPFKENISQLAENGKFLFGLGASGTNIDSFRIESNGAPSYVATVDAFNYNPGACYPYISSLQIDHSGATVYDSVPDADCFGQDFQYFKINDTTGQMTYEGNTGDAGADANNLIFAGNNKFAFSNICTVFDHEEVGYLNGFARGSSGKLSSADIGNPGPKTKESGNSYCPLSLATDPSGHLAALLDDEDADGDSYGNPVIASYSVSSSGKLTTSSTYKNMPQVTAGTYAFAMDTTGKLLAVGGAKGLELFHFNGSSPVTKYKTVLAGVVVDAAYWDKAGHLYVVTGNLNNPGHGKLYVYNVTSSKVSEASGSPYTVPNGYSIVVENIK
jgi:hypothetical protein